MRRSLFIIIALLMLVPAMLGARNLFEIGLGFSGIYDTNNPQDFDRFLEGMASGEKRGPIMPTRW